MTTAVATWGNSNAVRIPHALLKKAGLKKGDVVDLAINDKGRIEIIPEAKTHRVVQPKAGVTFQSLFSGFEGPCSPPETIWLDDDFVGAEREAWLE